MNTNFIVALIVLFVLYSYCYLSEGYCNNDKIDNCTGTEKGFASLECNAVPVFPRGLRPNQVVASDCKNEFDGLTPKISKYTLRVPELRYDGIFSKKNCKWTDGCTKPDTYSTNKYFHLPEKCMYGKTIIDLNPCSYDRVMYSRAMNLKENNIDECIVNSCAIR